MALGVVENVVLSSMLESEEKEMPTNSRKYQREYMREWIRKNPEIIKPIRTRARRKWRKNNRHKHRIFNLVYKYPNLYPLDDKCAFCGTTEKLEHGHLDYEDDGQNYLTVCHTCNCWMDRTIGD